ncbi:MAG: acetylxylan esterase [Planctomycetaceae bacterium]|nr:acetylxylan esterase [Planctomycetaceae bacterium]
MVLLRCTLVALFAALSLTASVALAEVPRALPAGKLPADARLGELKDLNGYFPMAVPASREEWEARAAKLRRQTLVANGLWPMPAKTSANAVIHGRVDRGTFTVEKVFFESHPGHFVTGSLYRPVGRSGKLPGVLCPHGHWANGRFYDAGPQALRNDLVNGAERFEPAGRYPLQARCQQLAKMGCVVFHYDMVGYADSVQLDHRPGSRSHMNTPENWGYFSPQAELRLQHMMGLQTYNSVRALDFLSELPDVDPERIGVTGASGGGTQTFILCAIDPRPKVAFPAVMVSTDMQGGCTCENCDYLRVGTGNIELAALFAPKPLGMSAALDWTREIATKGLPELQKLYALYGAEGNVMAKPLLQFGHNYNYVSRGVMYNWFNRHLGLGFAEPVVEEDFQPLTIAELSVWDAKHPRPPAGDDYERSLVQHLTKSSAEQIAQLKPSDEASLARYREVVGGAIESLVGRGLPPKGAVEFAATSEQDRDTYLEFTGLLTYAAQGEQVPVLFLHPKNWNKQAVIWLDEQGKAGLFDTGGGLKPEIKKLLDAGTSVAGIDLYQQGEFLADGQAPEQQRMVRNSVIGGYAGYTYGYNASLFAQRVHDVLTLIAFGRDAQEQPEQIHLVGLGKAGLWAAAARTQAGDAVTRTAVDTAGFRFATLTDLAAPEFWPGIVKYGDVPALLALCAPGPLWVAGEPADSATIAATFAAQGHPERLTLAEAAGSAAREAVVTWLLEPAR